MGTASSAARAKNPATKPSEPKGTPTPRSKGAGRRAPAGKIALKQAPWWLHPPILIAVVITIVGAGSVIGWSLSHQPASITPGSALTEAQSSPRPNEVPVEPAIDDLTKPRNDIELTTKRMEKLGASLLEQLGTDSVFPPAAIADAGLPPDQRLSWQAILADRFDGSHPPVFWDRPWNDPLNEPFVRRRLIEFQNPAIGTLTGVDGYPATHFVGVAGVGPGAAHLDARHPRAGIFSYDRQTRAEDLRDGAAYTWLVVGVQEQLGSWAAAGVPTLRALTREPYVNGPDGFGTGQADSMLVLMADGRVQTVSAAADPRILRAMATIADGQPRIGTDGEFDLAALTAASLAKWDEEIDEPRDPPLEAEFAPEPAAQPRTRRIDIGLSLKQPIVQFDQARSKPLAELLPGMAELVGSPIRYDATELGPAASGLKSPVTLRLQNTTVGEILDGLLKPAGLGYRVESDHIRLVPRE